MDMEFIQHYLFLTMGAVLTIKEIPTEFLIAGTILPGIFSASMCLIALRSDAPFLKPIELNLILNSIFLRKTSFLGKILFVVAAPITFPLYLFFVILIVIFFLGYNGGIAVLERLQKLIDKTGQ